MGFHKHTPLALLLGVVAIVASTSFFYVRAKHIEALDPQVKISWREDYWIESVSANKCVQFAGAPADEGEAQIRACDKSAAQRFQFDLFPDGYYRIRQAGTNKCLSIADGSRDDGAATRSTKWNGDAHQQWQVLGAGDGTVRLMARHSDKALDVWREGSEDGAPLKQMSWRDSRNQQFRLRVADPAGR